MTTITIKNIPDELYQALKQSAERNRRSLNSEIIMTLEQGMGSYLINPEEFIADARQLREQTAVYITSDEELIAAKNEGRA